MKLSTLTLMALATFSVAEDENAPSYICDTSEASPMVHHVEDIIRIAGDDHTGRKICYTPDPGIGCTSTQTALSGSGGGAAFTLCNGPNGLQGYRCQYSPITGGSGIRPLEVAEYFKELRDQCRQHWDEVDRVGGRVILSGGAAELRLFTMPA